MRERRDAYRVLVDKPEGRRPLEDPGGNAKIILKQIFENWVGRAWTESIWLRIGIGGGLL
jgi:hypothetical protein